MTFSGETGVVAERDRTGLVRAPVPRERLADPSFTAGRSRPGEHTSRSQSSATSPLRVRASNSASAAAETALDVGQVNVPAQEERSGIEDSRADEAKNR
jgi:hypothetical protein